MNPDHPNNLRNILASHDVELTLRELNSLIDSSSPLLPVWSGTGSRKKRRNDANKPFPNHVATAHAKAGPSKDAKLYSLTEVMDWLDGLESEGHQPIEWRAAGVFSMKTLLDAENNTASGGIRGRQVRSAIALSMLITLALESDSSLSLEDSINAVQSPPEIFGSFTPIFEEVASPLLSKSETDARNLVFAVLRQFPAADLRAMYLWALDQIPANFDPETPRAVADLIREVVDIKPTPGSHAVSILDPAAGSGTLLLDSAKAIAAKHEVGAIRLVANEIDANVAAFAATRWLFETDSPAARTSMPLRIFVQNSFRSDDLSSRAQHDLVVCDPPQIVGGDYEPADWLRLVSSYVAPQGQAAVVLPTSLLETSRSGESATTVSRLLAAGCVEAIILLPSTLRRASEKTGSALWLLRGESQVADSHEVLLVDASRGLASKRGRAASARSSAETSRWVAEVAAAVNAYRVNGQAEPTSELVKCRAIATPELVTADRIDVNPINYLAGDVSGSDIAVAELTIRDARANVELAISRATELQATPTSPDFAGIASSERKPLEAISGLEILPAPRFLVRPAAPSHAPQVSVVTGASLLSLTDDDIQLAVDPRAYELTKPGDVLVAISRTGILRSQIDVSGGRLFVRSIDQGPNTALPPRTVFTVRLGTSPEGFLTPTIVQFFVNASENAMRLTDEGLSAKESVGRLRLPILREGDSVALDGYLAWLNSVVDEARAVERTAVAVQRAVGTLSSEQFREEK